MLNHGKCVDCREHVDCLSVINSSGRFGTGNYFTACVLCVAGSCLSDNAFQGKCPPPSPVVKLDNLFRCAACFRSAGLVPFDLNAMFKTLKRKAPNWVFGTVTPGATVRLFNGFPDSTWRAWGLLRTSTTLAQVTLIDKKDVCFCNSCIGFTRSLLPQATNNEPF